MTQRWGVLALLFTVRAAMAFQFQTTASMSPALMQQYAVGLSDAGLLISLYLAPGLAFAIPGGQIGRRFGDKQVILFGLAMMIAGGLTMAFAPTWTWQIVGRVIAGTGGVLLNVLMSKMVTDWFAGREIATAMAIFVNSWPAGIALCLIVAPTLVTASGATAGFLVSTLYCVIGFVLLAALYKAPAAATPAATQPPSSWPSAPVLRAVIVAGCIWGLFNAALGMVFGFGTPMLIERGWTLAAAGSTVSVVLWFTTISVPIGGLLADRTGKPITIMLVSFALFAIVLIVATRTDHVVPIFIALGLVAGLPAGSIMSLPASVLSPPVRAVGMGVYLTMFYVFTVGAPILAGVLASRFGTARLTFDLGAVMLALCIPCYVVFRVLAAQKPGPV